MPAHYLLSSSRTFTANTGSLRIHNLKRCEHHSLILYAMLMVQYHISEVIYDDIELDSIAKVNESDILQ